ncbi:ABC transporter permease [Halopseudomonas pelagia]|uniref:ABC transporter permease n=1 Tax=Halopseudomonas pelagia TaxID=553151 RepID=UPI00039BCEB4|nr:ABC transporter permease subunit [Halopseudomonas pelagia]|tara:strand:+ start:15278 stop:16084 length:807 start_codon:yes stop_codon:yes gene_type:complete
MRLFLETVFDGARAALSYLWSGWGALASLLLFAAVWELAAQVYGPLVLPGPLATLTQLVVMFEDGIVQPQLIISARRTLYGLSAALLAGSLLGLLAGRSLTAAMLSRPLVTLLLGMPPIAWLVLAMLWFGMGDATPVFTVFIACFPIVFAAAMQGARTLDNQLQKVARAYRLPWRMLLTDLYVPHVTSYMVPAWVTALGTSWKVVVMAELLSTTDGVGAALAVSRAQLDTATSLAWIVAVLALLLGAEYLLLEPLKRRVERWRTVDEQ